MKEYIVFGIGVLVLIVAALTIWYVGKCSDENAEDAARIDERLREVSR